MCGCGAATHVARDSGYGYRTGEHRRFLIGHSARRSQTQYTVDSETGCWVWSGHINANGYAMMWDGSAKKSRSAHRVYYERARGPIPEGLGLDHLCRNRACVNPAHLEPVTNTENGRRGKNTKLSADVVAVIKHLLTIGPQRISLTEIARWAGVSCSCIWFIADGRHWKDIEPLHELPDGLVYRGGFVRLTDEGTSR
jgi:hypothetical protein